MEETKATDKKKCLFIDLLCAEQPCKCSKCPIENKKLSALGEKNYAQSLVPYGVKPPKPEFMK